MLTDKESEMSEEKLWVSWNENIKHSYDKLYKIKSETELVGAIKSADKIKVFGSKQSSSDIVGGVNSLIDISGYNKTVSVDKDTKEITVEAGMPLANLLETVEDLGWCIPCLPDINTVTIGGALATGTHGTSGKLLAEYVSAIRLILANGEVREVTGTDELMNALRVSIGALGVFSTVTFKCEEIYQLHLKEKPEHDDVWLPQIKERLKKHDFLRILWMPHTNHGYVITGDKVEASTKITEKLGPKFLKHRRTVSKFLYQYTHRFPRFTSLANKIIYNLFFRSEKEHKGTLYGATVTKSRGSTLELAEWTVGLDKFPQVFAELKQLIDSSSNNSYIHIPMDVRFVYEDKSWLSYAYGQDTVTMGCVSRNTAKADDYEAFETIEKIFLKYGGRPHWGKRFVAKDKEMNQLYPKWQEFKTLRKELDPTNKFLNPYLTALFDEK